MTDQAGIQRLIRSLRQDVMPDLSDQQLALILSWLAGSQFDGGAAEFDRLMGAAGENEAFTRQVFYQIDALLFRNEQLCLRSAGLAAARDNGQVRRRFRLLLSAFHPDRMQWHSDWLTPRFQAINQAYRTFKLTPAQESTALQPASMGPARPHSPPSAYRGISPGAPRAEARWRLWGRKKWLGQSVVAILSLVLVLPLLSWSLEGGWISGLFKHDQLTRQGVSEVQSLAYAEPGRENIRQERSPRYKDEPPTVASVMEQWNQVLLAGISDLPADPVEPWLPLPADLPLQETQDLAPVVTTAEPPPTTTAAVSRNRRCEADAPAGIFHGWLADQRLWSLAESPIGARPSRLRAGAVEGHALAVALENYRRSVEAGNLAQLARNYVDMPRANMQQGERWIQDTYGRLFDETVRRSLSLNVVEAYRHDEGWNVVARYELGVRLRDCQVDHRFEQELRFYLVQDPLLFRVAAVDY